MTHFWKESASFDVSPKSNCGSKKNDSDKLDTERAEGDYCTWTRGESHFCLFYRESACHMAGESTKGTIWYLIFNTLT